MKIILFILVVFGFLLTSSCVKNGADLVLQTIELKPETLTVAFSTPAPAPTAPGMQLTPVFTPSVFSTIAVEWTSTDNSVVTVSNGWITPKKVGTAWISIKDKNSATTGKCLIIVK
ncbi:MAG: hypothetical protein V4592_02935 [Bacteroidota bacterium]